MHRIILMTIPFYYFIKLAVESSHIWTNTDRKTIKIGTDNTKTNENEYRLQMRMNVVAELHALAVSFLLFFVRLYTKMFIQFSWSNTSFS